MLPVPLITVHNLNNRCEIAQWSSRGGRCISYIVETLRRIFIAFTDCLVLTLIDFKFRCLVRVVFPMTILPQSLSELTRGPGSLPLILDPDHGTSSPELLILLYY